MLGRLGLGIQTLPACCGRASSLRPRAAWCSAAASRMASLLVVKQVTRHTTALPAMFIGRVHLTQECMKPHASTDVVGLYERRALPTT